MASGKIHIMDCPHCGEAIYKDDGRGNPKISDATLRAALAKLGDRATQQAVADALGVTARGLEKWRKRCGISTWRELKSKLLSE
jgi:hypothetical protein